MIHLKQYYIFKDFYSVNKVYIVFFNSTYPQKSLKDLAKL